MILISHETADIRETIRAIIEGVMLDIVWLVSSDLCQRCEICFGGTGLNLFLRCFLLEKLRHRVLEFVYIICLVVQVLAICAFCVHDEII